MFKNKHIFHQKDNLSPLKLNNGSQIAVIGGGPAGCFFSYFLLDLAERVGIDVQVDIYERKDFSRFGPAGCNHCGGIISESLVQILSAEGINIPSRVVQRGIDAYVLHTDAGHIKIETPLHEKRIAAMYRGAGPLGTIETEWHSFDGFLQELILNKGANIVREQVNSIRFNSGLPLITTQEGQSKTYNLVVGAVGVNSNVIKLFEGLGFGYRSPGTTKTFIGEIKLGHEAVQRYFGSSMHVFLLNISGLEFAALIPKGDFISLVLLGKEIDKALVHAFLNNPEVKKCFPSDQGDIQSFSCKCFPRINTKKAVKPYTDRVVLIGDCGISKLYKNGIGAAYIAAKAAATTAIFHGISSNDFKKHHMPACNVINRDNKIGKLIFLFTRLAQKSIYAKNGILRVVVKEREKIKARRHMSTVLWDTFTGSASYLEILLRALRPSLIGSLIWETAIGIRIPNKESKMEDEKVKTRDLGKVYKDGEIIIKEGEEGDCLYVIQSGKVVVVQNRKGKEVCMREMEEGDFFGEMALFEREVRSSTVRAQGEARILTVDKKVFLRRIQEDPSMAFRIMEKMSSRIRKLSDQLSQVKSDDRRNYDTRMD